MLNKFLLTGLICLLFYTCANSQNVLDGVYIREFSIQAADSLSTVVKGKVVDKHTAAPLQNVEVRYTASNGQNIGVVTDQNGTFSFNNLEPGSTKVKIICSHKNFKTSTREFTVSGSSERREYNFNFEMEQK